MESNRLLTMLMKTLLTVLLLAAIVGMIGGLFYTNIRRMKLAGSHTEPPPIAVASCGIETMEWPVEARAIGSVSALNGVMLSLESAGLITELSFKSGAMVRKGDTLIRLDDSSEVAELAAAQANAELARLSLERSRQLLDRKTISQAEFDAANTAYKQAVAQLKKITAIINKKKLIAPFDGLLGIRRVNLGQYLNPGDPVVSLIAVDPINVTFFMPQKALSYLQQGLDVTIRSDAFLGIEMIGKLAALDARVDEATRMIEAQALMPNPDGVLRVGMFVNVTIDQAPPRDVLAVPASSVLYASYGNSIYTITSAESGGGFVVNQKFVKLGERRGDFIEVLEGLEPGERIVTDGAFKLYPGASVNLQDERAPRAELAPIPKDS